MRPLSHILLVISMAVLLPALHAWADAPEDVRRAQQQARREMLQRQRDHYQQSIKSLALLDEHRMTGILKLCVEDGKLAPDTGLSPWPNFMARRANIDGLTAPAVITYTQYIPDDPNGRQFEITLESYPDNDTYSRLHLLWRPIGPRANEISIESTDQTSDTFRRVLYMQAPLSARLIVFGNGNATDGEPQTFNVGEKDFATVRQKHPRQVERWLRPIFRQLQQDAAFAPDVSAAWQVLADDWPVQPQVTEQILRILPQLDAEPWRARDAASSDLASLGLQGATAILRLDRRGLTFEQNVRLDEVVSRFRRLPETDARHLGDDPQFLLDCQYSADKTVRQLAAARLTHVLAHPLALDPDAPDAERNAQADALRAQLARQPATQQAAIEPRHTDN